MSSHRCRACGEDIEPEATVCPHCQTAVNPNIPNYPTFGRSGPWFMVIMILFVTLIVALLVSMFTAGD